MLPRLPTKIVCRHRTIKPSKQYVGRAILKNLVLFVSGITFGFFFGFGLLILLGPEYNRRLELLTEIENDLRAYAAIEDPFLLKVIGIK